MKKFYRINFEKNLEKKKDFEEFPMQPATDQIYFLPVIIKTRNTKKVERKTMENE